MCSSDLDPRADPLRLLGEPALLDEECRLLLRTRHDLLGLLLRLDEDPIALGVDPLRSTDLLRHGDPELVDQLERRGLVDDDVAREGESLAVGDQRLEPLDEEDDVDGTALQSRRVRGAR